RLWGFASASDTPGAASLWKSGLTYGNYMTVISCMSFDSGAFGTGSADASPFELHAADLHQAFDDVEELSWQERALCAQTDPEAFFPEKGGSTREAKKIC